MSEERTGRLDPQLVVDALRKRWRFWLVPILVLPVIAVGLRLVIGPKLKASAQILVEERSRVNPVLKEMLGELAVSNRLQEISSLVRSSRTIERVLRELNLVPDGIGKKELQTEIDIFRSRVEVYGEGGGLIRITFVGRKPKEVFDALKLLTEELIEETVRPHRETSNATVQFLKFQLERVEEELTALEGEIRNAKANNPNYLPEIRRLKIATHQKLSDMLINSRKSLIEATEARRVAEEGLSNYDPGLDKLVRQLNAAQSQVNQMLKTYTRTHPDVLAAQRDLDALAERVRERGGNRPVSRAVRAGKDAQPTRSFGELVATEAAARETVDYLEAEVQASLRDLQAFADFDQTIEGLSRTREAKSQVYAVLLKRFEEAVVSQQLVERERASEIRIVEPPTEPSPSPRDSILLILIASILGGIVTGLGLTFVAEYLDPTVRTEEEVAELAGAPVIGVLSA